MESSKKPKPSRPSPSSEKVTNAIKRSPLEKSQKPKVKKDVPPPSNPLKRKPMIAESDSEDDFPPPPAPKKSVPVAPPPSIKKEPPATPTKPIDLPTIETKMEVDISQVKPEVTTPTPVKSKPVVNNSSTKKSSAKKAGMKRKKSDVEDEENDNDNDWSRGDDVTDDEFKPTIKKTKKTAEKEKKRKSTGTPKSAKKSTKPSAAKTKTPSSTPKKEGGTTPSSTPKKSESAGATPIKDSPTKKGRKKKEEEREVWKWWEEEPHPEGVKWLTLEHNGPYFAPPYEHLPSNVHFYYDGKPMELSELAEEAATFFAKMLDHDYTKKEIFCNNFFADWRKEMTPEEASKIKDFSKCDFREMNKYFLDKSEQRKQMSKEEKQKIKEENEKITEKYGWAIIDGHKEKIGNFKTEPPSLFRGRGDHPKQGKIKRRIQPEDVIINVGEKDPVPVPPEGHKWKTVQHDNKVTWLASWTDKTQGQIKYVMLNPTSRLKGEKDWAKYETARRLKAHIDQIRENYTNDLTSKEMRIRQRAVAMYFMDKLALRAGNEKDADETADTVGCCSLRVEHIKLHKELDGKNDVVEFDFLGKDSIRYYNRVQVSHQVFKNLDLFMKSKSPGDDLFDRLNTTTLNKHLSELMEGLTAKVFRTFNASITLQEQLVELTNGDDSVAEKFLSYNRANRAVAILCNHQRTAPKSFDQQMTNLQAKITAKEEAILDTKKEIKQLKKELKTSSDQKTEKKLDTKKKQLARLEEQHKKLEVQATDKEENKEIALGTSKLNYLDPRITVAWCKKYDVPVEKVYNRSQREKFAWAIDMADETFEF